MARDPFIDPSTNPFLYPTGTWTYIRIEEERYRERSMENTGDTIADQEAQLLSSSVFD